MENDSLNGTDAHSIDKNSTKEKAKKRQAVGRFKSLRKSIVLTLTNQRIKPAIQVRFKRAVEKGAAKAAIAKLQALAFCNDSLFTGKLSSSMQFFLLNKHIRTKRNPNHDFSLWRKTLKAGEINVIGTSKEKTDIKEAFCAQ